MRVFCHTLGNSQHLNPAFNTHRALRRTHCSLPTVLQFLQEGFEKRLSVSTLQAQWVSIKVFRLSWGNLRNVDDLVVHLLYGFSLVCSVVKPLYPFCDLPLVLKALVSAPFELMELPDIKFVSFKVRSLVAVTSARHMSEVGDLVAWEPFLSFSDDEVVLRFYSGFVLKVASQFHQLQEVVLLLLCGWLCRGCRFGLVFAG
ncbi:hypothetical protein NDU88_003670 [Pleurodeles waltl]|uniref:Uncharacterized protein n=1 Tax=Pleurodeles waltl TaxID=8319 RepID=A0AAV7W864_PLEWA|nr:hypothetical protein NDU88_003670 [Pleurodeles waltl]